MTEVKINELSNWIRRTHIRSYFFEYLEEAVKFRSLDMKNER